MSEIDKQVEEFDKYLDERTGKNTHKDNQLYATLFADTVQMRKDLILAEYKQALLTAEKRGEDTLLEELYDRAEEMWSGEIPPQIEDFINKTKEAITNITQEP